MRGGYNARAGTARRRDAFAGAFKGVRRLLVGGDGIALAAAHGMDFLLSWNFRHINNAETKARIVAAVESAGYECPVICSPEELGGDER